MSVFSNMRVGHGYDAHRLAEPQDGKPLMIGGVQVPHDRGLLAHSDGDVLLHAVCDAILGAIGKGDIGRHFPDNDEAFRNADSRRLLSSVFQMARADGWRLVNLDSTILAQAPRMAASIPGMCEVIAGLLELPVSAVNVKASTTEGMGFVGRREGIEAYAVVLLARD